MAYSTPAMVRQAADPTSDGTEPDPLPARPKTAADLSDAKLTDIITEADSTIDSYIGGFYATPVAAAGSPAAAPAPLPYWSRTIAVYLASSELRGELNLDDSNPILRRYKDVMAALQDVSRGLLKLSVPGNVSGSGNSGAGAPYNPYVGDLWTPDDFGVTPSGLNTFEPIWSPR